MSGELVGERNVPAVRSTIATAFLWIVFGPFGVFCLAWVCIYVARGEYLSAVVALGSAVFTLGLVVMLAFVALRKVQPRVQPQDDGILVRPDRRVDALLMASTFGGFVAMACYAIFAPLDMVVIRVPRGMTRNYFVFACAAAGFGRCLQFAADHQSTWDQLCPPHRWGARVGKHRSLSVRAFLGRDRRCGGQSPERPPRYWNDLHRYRGRGDPNSSTLTGTHQTGTHYGGGCGSSGSIPKTVGNSTDGRAAERLETESTGGAR